MLSAELVLITDVHYVFFSQGAHLPTPPPIPEAIAQSLASNAAAQAAQNQGQGGAPLQDPIGGFPSGPSAGYPSGGPTNQFGPQSDTPAASGPGVGGRPTNQYIPPQNQQPGRPGGNGSFNPQSGYRY